MTDEDDPSELLTLSYHADCDGTGKLTVVAASRGFAGGSEAWFDTLESMDFARSFRSISMG